MFRLFVVAGVGWVAANIVGLFVVGLLFIVAATVGTWRFIDDPGPGVSGLLTIGAAVLVGGGIGTLIVGCSIWLAIKLLREGLGWARARLVSEWEEMIR